MKTTHQILLLVNSGFLKKSNYKRYINKDILLTDDIYNRKVPEAAKGKFFRYIVTHFVPCYKHFTVKYKNEVIDPEGTCFYSYQEGNGGAACADSSETLDGVLEFTIEEGRERFLNTTARIKKEQNKKAFAIKKKLQKEAKNPKVVDLDDINDIARRSEQGGKSMEIILLEFKFIREVKSETGIWPIKIWNHKRTGREIKE